MKTPIYLLGLLYLFTFLTVSAQTAPENTPELKVNGFVRNYTGVLFDQGDFNMVENTLELTLKYQRKKTTLVATPFVYQYTEQDMYLGIRELYLDFYAEKVDIRIGKQQIIWGQADGVFITDIVSPKNLTEFLLRDFNEIRMGVTALKLNYYPSPDHTLEFVWMPEFTASIAPKEGSIWRPVLNYPAPPIIDETQKEITPSIKNSEVFIRYSLSKSEIDLQVIGGYTWDDDPVLHVNKQFVVDPITNELILSSILVAPKHHRLGLIGANFSTEKKGFIIRGEGAFYTGKYFQTIAPTATDALTKKDYVNYVVGLDKSFGEWKISGQFVQKIILDYDAEINEEETTNMATFLMTKTLMRETVRLELFSYIGLNDSDAFVRPRAYYFPTDGTSIEIGVNIFIGDTGTFGQYNKNDMIYTKLKYNF